MRPPDQPARVVVVGLGGTISMTATATGGVAPALSPDQLVAAVPGLADTPLTLEAVDLRRVAGSEVSYPDVHQVSTRVRAALAGGAAGAVLVQGTDTIEETAYLLDLWHPGPAPVVVTGAMRNPTLAGPDGPANLLGAVRTAAAPQARDQGALVVFADEIHAARRVRKSHSTSTGAFTSPNGGPLGYLVAGRPALLGHIGPRFTVPRPAGAAQPRVGIVTVSLSDRGELLDGLDGRLDGLVVAALGAGHVPEAMVAPLHRLARRFPVVLASRTGAGPVLTDTYGFPGSERDLIRRGLVPAGFLDPFKARVLLLSALAAGADRDTVAAAVGCVASGGYTAAAGWPWPHS